MNSLTSNEGDSTNPPHIYEELHEYDYIDVVNRNAGNMRVNVRDGAFSQCESHGVHNKRGDSTSIQECHTYENPTFEKDEEEGRLGQSDARNECSQHEALGIHKQSDSTDNPLFCKECHMYANLILEKDNEAGVMRQHAVKNEYSQREALDVNNKRGDSTDSPLFYVNPLFFEDCHTSENHIIKKDKEAGVMGQSASRNENSQCESEGVYNKRGDSTNTQEYRTHENPSIEEDGVMGQSAARNEYSQYEAHGVHNKQGDSTDTPLFYVNPQFFEGCHTNENLIIEKDKEAGIMKQSAARNEYYGCEARGFHEEKMEEIVEEGCDTEVETTEGGE